MGGVKKLCVYPKTVEKTHHRNKHGKSSLPTKIPFPPFITPSLHQPLDGFSFPFKPFSQEERRLDEKLFIVMTSMIIECLGYLIKVQHVIPLNFSILGVSGCNMFSNCWEYYNNCNSVLNFPKNHIRCINSTFKLNSLVHISICLVFFSVPKIQRKLLPNTWNFDYYNLDDC